MIFLLFFVYLLGYAIKTYNQGNKKVGAFIYFFFVSNGFYLIPDSVIGGFPINKLIDFGTLYLLYVTYNLYTGHTKKIKKMRIELKVWGILFLYLTFSFLWTIMFEKEHFGLSLATYRTYFCLFSFVIFQELCKEDLKWILQKVLATTLIATVLFVIQPLVGFKTLAGGSIGNEEGTLRYRNIPYITYFLLIFHTVTLDLTSWKKACPLILCAFALVLTQHRGIMMGYILTVYIYLLLERKFKKMFQFCILGILLFFSVGDLILSRFKKADTGSDFKTLVNLDYKRVNFEKDDEGGTLTFRILMLVERGEYLIDNPEYLFQGIGMRHEDSPRTRRDFNFIVGSRKKDGKGWVKEQISTGDLVWVTPLIKFGYIGLGLYLLITFMMVSFFYHNKNISIVAQTAFYYYLLLIFTSFKNDQLFSPIHLYMIFLLYQMIIREKQILIKSFKNTNDHKNENINSNIFQRR